MHITKLVYARIHAEEIWLSIDHMHEIKHILCIKVNNDFDFVNLFVHDNLDPIVIIQNNLFYSTKSTATLFICRKCSECFNCCSIMRGKTIFSVEIQFNQPYRSHDDLQLSNQRRTREIRYELYTLEDK